MYIKILFGMKHTHTRTHTNTQTHTTHTHNKTHKHTHARTHMHAHSQLLCLTQSACIAVFCRRAPLDQVCHSKLCQVVCWVQLQRPPEVLLCSSHIPKLKQHLPQVGVRQGILWVNGNRSAEGSSCLMWPVEPNQYLALVVVRPL